MLTKSSSAELSPNTSFESSREKSLGSSRARDDSSSKSEDNSVFCRLHFNKVLDEEESSDWFSGTFKSRTQSFCNDFLIGYVEVQL